jgi:hypothetical protein
VNGNERGTNGFRDIEPNIQPEQFVAIHLSWGQFSDGIKSYQCLIMIESIIASSIRLMTFSERHPVSHSISAKIRVSYRPLNLFD